MINVTDVIYSFINIMIHFSCIIIYTVNIFRKLYEVIIQIKISKRFLDLNN